MKFYWVEVDPPRWLRRRRMVWVGQGTIIKRRGANVGRVHESWIVREEDRKMVRKLRKLQKAGASLGELSFQAGISPR